MQLDHNLAEPAVDLGALLVDGIKDAQGIVLNGRSKGIGAAVEIAIELRGGFLDVAVDVVCLQVEAVEHAGRGFVQFQIDLRGLLADFTEEAVGGLLHLAGEARAGGIQLGEELIRRLVQAGQELGVGR